MQYLIVEFPESREVLVDGVVQGQTNKTLTLEQGHYQISLGRKIDFSPESQAVVLQGTSPIKPMRIPFKKI